MNNLTKRKKELEQPLLKKDVGEKNELIKRIIKLTEKAREHHFGRTPKDFINESEANAEIKGIKFAEDEIFKIINEYIKTDLHGSALPECKVLWELKKKIKGE